MDKFETIEEERKISISFSSTVLNVDKAVKTTLSFLKSNRIGINLFNINLILRESLANAVKHGNCNDPSKKVIFEIEEIDGFLNIKIEDKGDGFNWRNGLVKKESDVFTPGGRGLPLMKAYGFELSYNEKGNILFLRKKTN